MSSVPRQVLGTAALAGVGFFAMSVVLLGVWPGEALEEQTRRTSPAHLLRLTLSEQRGREIYAREGCAYCHTEQIRSTPADTARFGFTTAAWETQFDYPHLWGTRRIGPDLSRESGKRPEDWQWSHLYAPRAIVPDSVMPAFPGMFDGAPDRPLQEARDLVAYVESLGRARALVEPNRAQSAVAALSPAGPPDSSRGDWLYAHNCAGCHGAAGEGDGPGSRGLHPRPASLAAHDYGPGRIASILRGGIRGTAMPGWRELSPTDLEAVAVRARAFYRPGPEPADAPGLGDLGAQVYRDHCAECHGDAGAGDGYAASELRIPPTDFTRERPTAAEALRALRNGVADTPMAPWNTKLSEPELTAVALYVRGFFR